MSNMKIDVDKAAQASQLLKKTVNVDFSDFIGRAKSLLETLPENAIKEGVMESFRSVCKNYNEQLLPLFNDIDKDFQTVPEIKDAINKLGAGVNQVRNIAVAGKASSIDPAAFKL